MFNFRVDYVYVEASESTALYSIFHKPKQRTQTSSLEALWTGQRNYQEKGTAEWVSERSSKRWPHCYTSFITLHAFAIKKANFFLVNRRSPSFFQRTPGLTTAQIPRMLYLNLICFHKIPVRACSYRCQATFARKIWFSSEILFTDQHRTESNQHAPTRTTQYAFTANTLPVSGNISPALYQLHWLPVYNIVFIFKILILTFKAIHGSAPKYIIELINIKPRSIYNLRSNQSLLLDPPKGKMLVALGDRSFSVAAPYLWNSLPAELRDIQSLAIFKCKLKTYLFRVAFTT